MKMYCVLLSVIFLMSPVAMVVSVGSSTRYYENGTSVTCLGIVCPLDEIFVPCTHSLGDGKHDTCEPCPFDRPRTLSTFDSSAFEDPPVDFACTTVLDRCECAEEAELVNPLKCNKTLEPVCKCKTTAGYYGQDPKACQLSENKKCQLPGYELKQDGSCDECPGDTYKDTHQFGRCLLQPICRRLLVVDNPGDSAHRRTCKHPVTTPPPDRRVTTRESTSATDIEYSTQSVSYSTLNVTASTNQTTPLIDTTNFEWIVMSVVAVVAIVLLIVFVFICVNRRKKRQNNNRRQDKGHQKDGDCVGLIVNRNQQGNSGDSHKLSCGFKMFPRMICQKTCGSFKWPTQVKTTTKNERRNTVDGDKIKEKGNSNGITEKGNSDEIAEKGNSDKIAENENVYGTFIEMNAEKVNGGETAEKVNGGETAEKVNGGETAEKVNGGETAEKVNGDETAEKVIGGETAEKVNGGETAEKVNGGGTAEKVTKIESSENTTINPCATENHDASSYGRLNVDSLVSSGKTSSGFVDMHILKWNPSSSKGFIECTDTSGKQFKSMTIDNGSQGMILLKMKDIGKGYKFIFVSSNENSKIESYVEVGVKPVTNNFDLNTLLESGLSTLDFSSSDFVQNRPEEDLPSHRLQKGSLDQLNHMSLQHSQNQADSGISDTTPAECSNQAGDSLPHLNVSSLNQDVDNDEN